MRIKTLTQALAGIFAFSPWLAFAFNSGSTGADGAFSPTVSQEVVLPPSGVFNFTNVNIPAGVTITFKKNAANTPVVILASGDAAVAGTINVSGTASPNVGASGNGALGDDGMPGVGGPGGYDGGRGGKASAIDAERGGGTGLGPGAGIGAAGNGTGGSGRFGALINTSGCIGAAGQVYGSALLLPLIGGSGGGGGHGGASLVASGGGGGGGAIMIAASGIINVTGAIRADGGGSGSSSGDGCGSSGGGGSGGAIRLVATTIAGNGTISAAGGGLGAPCRSCYDGFNDQGGPGRIRLEAENMTRTAATAPGASVDLPGALYVSGLPTLTIISVAGVAAPTMPTGNADITLPQTTANPVTVEFKTTGVPVGNIVKVTVTPAYGDPVRFYSPALVGDTANATASAQVTLPTGPSTLQAQTTYTIVAAQGDALSVYAKNERVEKIELSSTLGGPSIATLITVSGKRYDVPAALLAMMPG